MGFEYDCKRRKDEPLIHRVDSSYHVTQIVMTTSQIKFWVNKKQKGSKAFFQFFFEERPLQEENPNGSVIFVAFPRSAY